jgi:hypothetical protein
MSSVQRSYSDLQNHAVAPVSTMRCNIFRDLPNDFAAPAIENATARGCRRCRLLLPRGILDLKAFRQPRAPGLPGFAADRSPAEAVALRCIGRPVRAAAYQCCCRRCDAW